MTTTQTRGGRIHPHDQQSTAASAAPAGLSAAGWLSAAVAALMTLASVGGLVLHGLYHDNTWSTAAYRGTDLATLLFAVPTLLAAGTLARRGSERARLVWLGVLAYNIYNYAFYLFGAAFNDFFLVYAALLALCLVTVIYATPAVLAAPAPAVVAHRRLLSGYMALVGTMFAAMWIIQSLAYVLNGTLPKGVTDSGIHTSVVFGLDLTLIIPAFLAGAVLLWRRRAAGFVLAVTMNVVGLLYMLALAFGGGFQANAGVPDTSWAATPYTELAVTSLAACWLLLRRRSRHPTPAGSC